MKMLKLIAVAALASAATLAMADEKVVTDEGVATFSSFKPAQLRAEIGTVGYGGAVAWSLNPYTALTLGYNGGTFKWSGDLDVNGVTYDVEFKQSTPYLNAEIRPFANSLYVAAGVAYLDNDYSIDGKPDGLGFYEIDGTKYDAKKVGNLNGKLSYKSTFAPYLGLGFSPSITKRVGLFGEVGAYYTGNPEVTLTGDKVVAGSAEDLAIKKEIDQIRQDTAYEFFPVIKVGLSARF
ncbi:MAG: hypothetical protein E6Q25_01100 [Acinetobacter sp.]|jgi:hypothetical protein|nr:MAG: hypothetical protein E6Q25_01100 [Acinetobacter sp.]